MVQCVCRRIPAEDLGHCQIHEHIWVRPTPMSVKNPALCMDDYDASLRELLAYKALGGTSIVDAQPVAAGRDALVLERLSRESGVPIIASTGYHLLGFYETDSWVHTLDEDGLCSLYFDELTQGMFPWQADPAVRPTGQTSVLAGMVKAAIPAEGPIGRYETLLRAAARAAAKAGVPLMLHTDAGKESLRAIDLCRSLGVAPEKMVVCHVDRQASDFGPHDDVAATGVYLDYDTVGRFKYHSDEEEVALLRHMKPYEDRILLSLDTTAARLGAYGGEIDLGYVLTSFVPRLLEAGFSRESILRYTQDNCRQLFAGSNSENQ